LQLLGGAGWGLVEGFDGNYRGVWCDDRPRDVCRAAPGSGVMIGGPEGDTVLCADVPEEVFRALEVQESTQGITKEEEDRIKEGGPEPEGLEYQRMGYAMIPADVLSQYGRPQLYDHEYGGSSRRELLRAMQVWKAGAAEAADEVSRACRERKAQSIRDAVAFFDKVGWQTPLSLREAAPEDPLKPGPWGDVDELEDWEEG
jgi:hypothetical protein